MGGSGVWTKAIEKLSEKSTLNIDIQTKEELKNARLKIFSKNVINGNLMDLKLDNSINAIFIRSGLRSDILENLLINNPHIDILIYCEIRFSLNESVGIEKLFTKYEKILVKNKLPLQLGSCSNLVFDSEKLSVYNFHVFTKSSKN